MSNIPPTRSSSSEAQRNGTRLRLPNLGQRGAQVPHAT